MEQQDQPEILEIEEAFAVKPDELFDAWTNEQRLKQWWRPMETSLSNVKAELRSGGALSYEFDGAAFKIDGNYEAVQAPSKLRYSWNWEFNDRNLNNESFVLDIEFVPSGSGSILKVKQQGFKHPEEKKAHEEGWKAGMQQLHGHLGDI